MPRKDIKIRETTVKQRELKNNSKKKKTSVEYEIINGVYLRKNRLDTVITVDIQNIIIGISGKNPKKFKVGQLYE